MLLDDVLQKLRDLNEAVLRPLDLPTEDELNQLEKELGTTLHQDYRRFLLEASNVVYGSIEPATVTDPEAHTHLATILKDAREVGVPEHLLPICEDNGSYYCMGINGEVVFWDHNGLSNESWPNLASWIEAIWIQER